MDTRHKGGWLLGCVWGQWRDMVSSVVVLRFLHMSTIAPPFWRTYPGFLGLNAQLSVLVCPPLLVISRSSPLWHYLDVNCQVSSSVLNSSHHPYVLCTQTPTRWE